MGAAPGKAAARMAVPKKSHRPRPLPQHYVEEHHDDEADHEAGGAVGLVALALGLRDDLVSDDADHRSGRKGEAPGTERGGHGGDGAGADAVRRVEGGGVGNRSMSTGKFL